MSKEIFILIQLYLNCCIIIIIIFEFLRLNNDVLVNVAGDSSRAFEIGGAAAQRRR
jgi:hypothetical protein